MSECSAWKGANGITGVLNMTAIEELLLNFSKNTLRGKLMSLNFVDYFSTINFTY